MDSYCTPGSSLTILESLGSPQDSQAIYLSSLKVPEDGLLVTKATTFLRLGVARVTLKNHSSSPGVRASPPILARPARRGGNPAHPAPPRGAREPASSKATAAGGGARRTAPPPSACALPPGRRERS